MKFQNWISAREVSLISLLAQSGTSLREEYKREVIQSLTGTAKAIAEAILGIGDHPKDITSSAEEFKKWAEEQAEQNKKK